MQYYTQLDSPLGRLTLTGDEEHLHGLWLAGQQYEGNPAAQSAVRRDDLPLFVRTAAWLARYFDGQRPDPAELPLEPSGSPYRQRVFAILRAIPYGATLSYQQIADTLNRQPGAARTSARAVGGAVGHNPLSIIIPCHRVVGADAGLTGYAGGLERKAWLLKHEGVQGLKG